MTLCMALCCPCLNSFAQNVPNYVPTDGLVAWWPMNGNVYDATGSLDGFNQGGIETYGPGGQIGQALELPSGDDYIDLPTGEVSEEGGLTLAFWAWLEFPDEGSAPLIDRIGASNNLWSLSYEESSETVHFMTRNNDGSGYHNLSTWSPPEAQWVHVTTAYRASSSLKDLYANGSLVGSELAPLQGFTMPTIRLGEVAEGIWNSNCRFSKVGIWNRALTEEEILALYNAQLPVLGCTNASACNFNEEANEDNGSCVYPLFGDDCEEGGAACGEGTIWDVNIQACVVSEFCQEDLDGDGVIGVNDLMQLLSTFGTMCEIWMCGDPVNYHDYDYSTVQIGEQCWFAENLRTDTYTNGDAIAGDLSDAEWAILNSGAQAAYNNDSAMIIDYGRFYNWYAVDDSRGLCPTGWNLPTHEEFNALTDYVGGTQVAGGALKASIEDTPEWNGTNGFGFNARPSGYRNNDDGEFLEIGETTIFWASTSGGSSSWYRMLQSYTNWILAYSNGYFTNGYTVRCLKDTE